MRIPAPLSPPIPGCGHLARDTLLPRKVNFALPSLLLLPKCIPNVKTVKAIKQKQHEPEATRVVSAEGRPPVQPAEIIFRLIFVPLDVRPWKFVARLWNQLIGLINSVIGGHSADILGELVSVINSWTVRTQTFEAAMILITVMPALNPFTPESDQCQISPAASPEILHHTVRRTWLFIAYSGER